MIFIVFTPAAAKNQQFEKSPLGDLGVIRLFRLISLNENEIELKKDIKISYAMRLYQLEKLTIGKAAQLAGLSRFEFEMILSENRISVSNLDIDDVKEDLKNLK